MEQLEQCSEKEEKENRKNNFIIKGKKFGAENLKDEVKKFIRNILRGRRRNKDCRCHNIRKYRHGNS